MILISFTLDLIAMTSENKGKIGLVFCRRKLRIGTRVKEYRYQRKVFRNLMNMKAGKAPGPDYVLPSVLKSCANESSKILCEMLNASLRECVVPAVWKISSIIPVPQKQNISCMNDLRPIALTSCVMKVFERCVLFHLNKKVLDYIDPYQFAYKSKRGVEDAITHALHNIYTHLDLPGATIRLLFFDFSSALNTIQPHLLCDKLLNMNLCPSLITWIMNYLTSIPQYVRLRPSTLSDVIITNTGAPQGTVLSPFLFSLYTSDCRATHNNCFIDKYADDTVLTGMILNDNFINYTQEVVSFVDWCDSTHLVLNVTKTKEMVIDFRKQTKAHLI